MATMAVMILVMLAGSLISCSLRAYRIVPVDASTRIAARALTFGPSAYVRW